MNEHPRPAKSPAKTSAKPPAKTATVSVAEAKARFSELLNRAQAGERLVVTRHGKAVAEIGPPEPDPPRRKLRGAMKGELWIAPDFDELGPEWDEYVK